MTEIPETPGAQQQAAKAAARKRTSRTRTSPDRNKAQPPEVKEADAVVQETRVAQVNMILGLLDDLTPEDWKVLAQNGFAPTTAETWRRMFAGIEIPKVTMGPPMPLPAEPPSVDELWSDVMESVRSIGKGDYNEDQGFRFRGVDSVVDAVGPALRRARVKVIPKQILEHHAEYYETKRGTRMVNRTVRMQWEVRGPRGDSFVGESMGEAADAGDKSMSKAQSVAYRVFLLQALNVPTGQPDPDSESHERATVAERGAQRQDEARQAAAGEENQDAPGDSEARKKNEAARKALWRRAKGLGWEWPKLAARFKSDHGMETGAADAETIEAFTMAIVKEAEADEKQRLADAKKAAEDVLGAKEVQDEAQAEGEPSGHF